MTSLTLSFNQVNLTPVERNDNQIWLTSSELAKALGYKSAKSVTNLYNAREDEFTSSMTEVIETVTSSKTKGLMSKIRIFSLRGCHLIAMFARTKVAKDFRIWALNILDKEVGQPEAKSLLSTVENRRGLVQAVNKLRDTTGQSYKEAWLIVHQRFNIESVEQLTVEQVYQATEYIHKLTLGIEDTPTIDNSYNLKMQKLGLHRANKTKELLATLETAVTALDYCQRELKRNNDTQVSIFNTLSLN